MRLRMMHTEFEGTMSFFEKVDTLENFEPDTNFEEI